MGLLLRKTEPVRCSLNKPVITTIMKKASHQIETYPGDRLIIGLRTTL
jgi:hypothetical protein